MIKSLHYLDILFFLSNFTQSSLKLIQAKIKLLI